VKVGSGAAVSLLGLAFVGMLTLVAPRAAAQPNVPDSPAGPTPTSYTMSPTSATFDVRTLPALPTRGPDRDRIPEREEPRTLENPSGEQAPVGSGTSIEQSAPAPSPTSSFEGLAFNDDCGGVRCGQGHPPDTNGDVGPTYYIETVNTAIAIYNKSTGSRVAAFSFNSFMSQGNFGNL
jgi:hypothetical protein